MQYVFGCVRGVLSLGCVLISSLAWGTPAGLTFQGRLVKNDVAVDGVVDVTIKVTSIAVPMVTPECVLFEETHHLNLAGSDGFMTLKIGGGTRTASDKGLTLTQIFSNTGIAITGLSCSGAPGSTSYTPLATDSRNVYVSFVDGTDTIAFGTPYVIQSVPYAIESERLAGKPASEYLQVTANTTQTKLNDLMVPATYAELLQLINGTSSQYLTSSTSGVNMSGAADRTIDMARQTTANTAGHNLTISASGAASGATDKAGGDLVLSSGTATGSGASKIEFKTSGGGSAGTTDSAPSTKMTVLGSGDVGIGTATPSSRLEVSGGAITAGPQGTVAGSGGEVRFSELASQGSNYVGFKAPDSLAASKVWTLPPADGSSGQVLTTDGSGVLNWASVSAGGLSAVSNSALLANGKVWIGDGSGKAQEQTLSGDVTITNAGAATVAKIQGVAVSSTAPTADGQVLRFNGTQYQGKFLTVADLHSSVGPGFAQAFPSASCTAGQTLTWSSITDTLTCTDITIASSKVTGLGTAAALDVGTGNNNIVQLSATGKMPAVDGSALTTLNASNISSGTLNAARLPNPSASTLGGVQSYAAVSNQWITSISTSGVPSSSQPAFSNLSGTAAVSQGGTGLTSGTSGGIPYFSSTSAIASSGALSQYQVVLGGGAGGAPTVVSGTGTSGQVLTSNGSGAAPTWQAAPSGSSQWTTTGSDIYYTTGKVGVGTNSPGQPLTIAKDGDYALQLQTSSTNQWTGIAYAESGGAKRVVLQKNGDNSFSFWTATGAKGSESYSERITMDTSGKLGVGTNSPAQLLEVKGSPGSPATSGTTQNGVFRLGQGTSNNVMDFGSIGTSPWTVWIQSANRGGLNTNNPLALNPNGGNVGIGTANPARTLHIGSGGDLTSSVNKPNGVSSQYMLISNGTSGGSASAIIGVNDGTRNTRMEMFVHDHATAGSGSWGLWSTYSSAGAQPFVIGVNDGEKLRITSTGYVGIGTTSPSNPLDVRASVTDSLVKVQNTSASGWSGFDFFDSAGTKRGYLGWGNASASPNGSTFYLGSDTNHPVVFMSNATERMRINGNGNVGIGTTPSYALHVVGAGGATIAYFSDGSQSCSIKPSTAGNISCSSDERLKKDITRTEDTYSLEKILQLSTVTYRWRNGDEDRHTGFLAQEVEKVAPEMVTTSKDGYKQVSYAGFIPWITGAIKELHRSFGDRVEGVESENAALRIEVETLHAENADLKKRLEAIEQRLNIQ